LTFTAPPFGGVGVGCAQAARGVNLGIAFVEAKELQGLGVASYVHVERATGDYQTFRSVEYTQPVSLPIVWTLSHGPSPSITLKESPGAR